MISVLWIMNLLINALFSPTNILETHLLGQQVVRGSCSSFRTYGRSVLAVFGSSAVLMALWTVTSVSAGFRSNVSMGLASDSSRYNSRMLFSRLPQRFSQPGFPVLVKRNAKDMYNVNYIFPTVCKLFIQNFNTLSTFSTYLGTLSHPFILI